jgi:hypothetical protein
MIPIQCPTCGKHYSVSDELALKQAKCPCGAMMNVPASAVVPQVMADAPSPSIVAGEGSVVKAEINASRNVGHLAGDMVHTKTVSNTSNQVIHITNNESLLGALTGSRRKEMEALEREFSEASKSVETLIAFITKQIAAIETSSPSETKLPVFKARFATGMQAVSLLEAKPDQMPSSWVKRRHSSRS